MPRVAPLDQAVPLQVDPPEAKARNTRTPFPPPPARHAAGTARELTPILPRGGGDRAAQAMSPSPSAQRMSPLPPLSVASPSNAPTIRTESSRKNSSTLDARGDDAASSSAKEERRRKVEPSFRRRAAKPRLEVEVAEEGDSLLIDPDSTTAYVWASVLLSALLYNVAVIPFRWAFMPPTTSPDALWIASWVCDGVFAFDMFVVLNSGYYDQGNKVRSRS